MSCRKNSKIINDFHLHLSGSLSRNFLKKTAEKNKVKEIFIKLDEIHQKRKRKEIANNLKAVWTQFSLVSQIIKTPEDIRLGVMDVVEHSEAIDLEIRSTPKVLDGTNWLSYANAFVNGLLDANARFPDKNPRGMLSLDRTIHKLQEAKQIIDYVDEDPTGMLVGIDICGNPADHRVLTGSDLSEAIMYVLEKNMGIALHLGEIDSDIERQDTTHILTALETWQFQQKSVTSNLNPFHGKVRLGHAIFLTPDQRNKIKKLDLPIEICPSCHEQLSLFTHDEHPVTKVYSPEEKKTALNVLPGTDDCYIFDCSARLEAERVSRQMKCTPEQSVEIAKQQDKFKFGHFSQMKLCDGKNEI